MAHRYSLECYETLDGVVESYQSHIEGALIQMNFAGINIHFLKLLLSQYLGVVYLVDAPNKSGLILQDEMHFIKLPAQPSALPAKYAELRRFANLIYYEL